jgi:hypothetical protein
MRMEQGHFGPCIILRHDIYCSFNRILFFNKFCVEESYIGGNTGF